MRRQRPRLPRRAHVARSPSRPGTPQPRLKAADCGHVKPARVNCANFAYALGATHNDTAFVLAGRAKRPVYFQSNWAARRWHDVCRDDAITPLGFRLSQSDRSERGSPVSFKPRRSHGGIKARETYTARCFGARTDRPPLAFFRGLSAPVFEASRYRTSGEHQNRGWQCAIPQSRF